MGVIYTHLQTRKSDRVAYFVCVCSADIDLLANVCLPSKRVAGRFFGKYIGQMVAIKAPWPTLREVISAMEGLFDSLVKGEITDNDLHFEIRNLKDKQIIASGKQMLERMAKRRSGNQS